MRKLKSTDIFAALRVVKEVGIQEEMRKFAKNIQTNGMSESSQRELGIELIAGILGNAGSEKAEDAIYKFLSAPMEIPVAELKDMDALAFMEKVKEFVFSIEIEAWKSFFTSLVGMTSRAE